MTKNLFIFTDSENLLCSRKSVISKLRPINIFQTQLQIYSGIILINWSNEPDLRDSEYFITTDFDSNYAELMDVLCYNSESHSQKISMVWMNGWMDGVKRFVVLNDEFKYGTATVYFNVKCLD